MSDKEILKDEDVTIKPIEEDEVITVRLDYSFDKIQMGESSDIGCREYQQDALKKSDDLAYMDSQRIIAILCDGMGGLNGGEIASNFCADTLYNNFYSDESLDDVTNFFYRAIHRANSMVCEFKDENNKPLNAGTTLASVIIKNDRLFWASVGDSRIYLIRRNEIVQITEDHNYLKLLNEQVKKGTLTKKEAHTHPKREALISYIGIGEIRYIDANTNPFKLEPDDFIIICSDGLYRSIDEGEMMNIIYKNSTDMNDAAKKLTECAIKKGKKHQDNTSVITIHFLDIG